MLSSRATSEQSVVYLNRVLVWDPIQRSAYLGADARRVKESAKEVATLAVKRSVSDVLKADRESQNLDDEKVGTYRSVTMRIMCLNMDRPDISYAASMQARRIKEPRETNMEDLKRIGRYLKKCPAGRMLFPSQGLPDKISVYCDSDYAGDP
eukprot:3412455-Pyramimonas_sp.AAC.1